MIHRLTLGNFKPFRDTHEAPLAPITLVYGPNSAGKSSLIQSLLLLKQTLAEGLVAPEDSFPLRIHGDLVDLGSWESLINGHEEERNLILGLTVPWAQPPLGIESDGPLSPWAWFADSELDKTTVSVRFRFRRPNVLQEFLPPLLDLVSFKIDPPDHPPFIFSVQQPWDDEFFGNPLFLLLEPAHTSRLSFRWRRRDQDTYAELLLWLRDKWKAWARSATPNRDSDEEEEEATELFPWRHEEHRQVARLFEAISSPELQEWLLHAEWTGSRGLPFNLRSTTQVTDEMAVSALGLVMSSISNSVLQGLAPFSYLGPLRTPPSRVVKGETSVQRPTGEDVVRSFCTRGRYEYKKLDEWFQRLEVPYRLRVRKLPAEIFGELYAIVLKDRRTGVEVSPTEVGFGIGQMLPILLQGLENQRTVTCVEQPEIHVHPKLQAHLADFFIETTGSRSSQWIIETHSEALMLRLQRRIREGKLSPDDVAVLYVEPGEEGSRILHLRLAEDGEFIDEWPEGFFEERYDEMFGGEE